MEFINKTYEEVVDIVDGLLNIDSNNLDAEALRNNKIFPQLSRIYIQHSRKLMELTNQLDKLEHRRRRHYSGKETAEHYRKEPLNEAILKSDIDSYLNIDPLVVEMRKLVHETERTVKFLEEAKGTLKSRGFDIKNAIDYRKLMLGA